MNMFVNPSPKKSNGTPQPSANLFVSSKSNVPLPKMPNPQVNPVTSPWKADKLQNDLGYQVMGQLAKVQPLAQKFLSGDYPGAQEVGSIVMTGGASGGPMLAKDAAELITLVRSAPQLAKAIPQILQSSGKSAQEIFQNITTAKKVENVAPKVTEAQQVTIRKFKTPQVEQPKGLEGGGGKEQIAPKTVEVPTSQNQAPTTLKVSKIAKEIDAKAVEKKYTEGFSELSGYEPKTVKQQAQLSTKLINNDWDTAQAIIRGEKPLPKDIDPAYFVKAMEEALEKNYDPKLLQDLVKSPLITETSGAAQTLRMAAERDPYSPVNIIRQLEDDRRAVMEKRLGKSFDQTTKETIKDIKSKVKAPSKYDWAAFLDEIKCK